MTSLICVDETGGDLLVKATGKSQKVVCGAEEAAKSSKPFMLAPQVHTAARDAVSKGNEHRPMGEQPSLSLSIISSHFYITTSAHIHLLMMRYQP